MFCFFLLRHVNNEITNEYWQESCEKINQYYPECQIFIIDDHSKPEYIIQSKPLNNITVIQCELPPGKGELLPYYYFHKLKSQNEIQYEYAIIIHDSLFLNSKLFTNENMPSTVMFFWHTKRHGADNKVKELDLLRKLKNNSDVINLYINKSKWNVCFGVMSVIKYDFLDHINSKYDFFNILIPLINTKDDRMRLERIYGVICMAEDIRLAENKSYLGDICHHVNWGYSWSDYKKENNTNKLIKVFTGR
jgi:hypothetical protein